MQRGTRIMAAVLVAALTLALVPGKVWGATGNYGVSGAPALALPDMPSSPVVAPDPLAQLRQQLAAPTGPSPLTWGGAPDLSSLLSGAGAETDPGGSLPAPGPSDLTGDIKMPVPSTSDPWAPL